MTGDQQTVAEACAEFRVAMAVAVAALPWPLRPVVGALVRLMLRGCQ